MFVFSLVGGWQGYVPCNFAVSVFVFNPVGLLPTNPRRRGAFRRRSADRVDVSKVYTSWGVVALGLRQTAIRTVQQDSPHVRY